MDKSVRKRVLIVEEVIDQQMDRRASFHFYSSSHERHSCRMLLGYFIFGSWRCLCSTHPVFRYELSQQRNFYLCVICIDPLPSAPWCHDVLDYPGILQYLYPDFYWQYYRMSSTLLFIFFNQIESKLSILDQWYCSRTLNQIKWKIKDPKITE